jgi:hypothetical protein
LPWLCALVSSYIFPTLSLRLGIDTSMLEKKLEELPAILCGVYEREVGESMEQDLSVILFPFVVEIYIGETDPEACYIKSLKWATVMDKFVEIYGSQLLTGYEAPESPDISITYTLQLRDETYRQLITTMGVIGTVE